MTTTLGAFGESWAVGYLVRNGYRIVDRNVRYREGEIDVVARQDQDLVFVEVKCRRSERFGVPQASITRRRYQHLAAAIARYLEQHDPSADSYRIDVVSLLLGRDGAVRSHQLIRSVEAPSR
ncbi:MAG: YraN family protein [Chloroflexota bacterium]